MTIRERIQGYQSEVINGNLLPGRASEILMELSALLGNINDEIVFRDISYNKVLLQNLENEKTAVKAKIKAETSLEYETMRTARNAEKTAIELIRSLKYYLKAKEEEYKQSNNF